ncbi:MAG TPA: transporter substrate-binding domain-containing protein [Anaeromyxobacteraceae bacterium]|nr:transporter substrate-binding domain-containing protein [Anaeromyxobacteraceae bacterium]
MPRLRRHALARLAALAALLGPARAAAQAGLEPLPAAAERVVVGADRDYPPYEFLDKNGQPAGFNVDLTRALAEVMGMQVEFRFGTWSEIRAGMADGRIDLLQGISWSEARARELDFAAPHAVIHHAIFARKTTRPVASLDELRGKKVLVFGGGIMDEQLTRRGYGPDLVRAGTPADALQLLEAGRADYLVVAALPGIWLSRELGLADVVPVARSVAAERYGYAVRKGNAELLGRIDEGLAILRQTGRYEAIHHKWLGPLEPQGVPWGTVARWGAAVLVPLLLGLGGTVLWSRSLKRQVAQRTESLALEVAQRERAVEELRIHQQQLVQADKMAALGVLVSGVAHEINNPNGYILLNMPILKAAFEDALEALETRGADTAGLTLGGIPWERMREQIPLMLEEMQAGGRRIKHIVEDLKDFARREDSPALEAVDLNEVARAAVRLLGAAITRATHRFELELGEGLPRVRANGQRIEQVVVNLLVNACEALPDPGRRVRLATRHDAARGQVVLEVADEGVGIKPEDLARVTDPFFTTKRARGGTGLGLSVSAGIVKAHGGTLELASAPGRGTTATLGLPPAEEPRA